MRVWIKGLNLDTGETWIHEKARSVEAAEKALDALRTKRGGVKNPEVHAIIKEDV